MASQEKQIEFSGVKLIKALHYLINNVKIYNANNQLIKDGISLLNEIISQLPGEEHITIQVWRGRLHIQGERLIYRRDSFHIINEMLEYFAQRKLGELRLLNSLRYVSADDMVAFFHLLDESAHNIDPPAWLDQQLKKNEFSWVQIFKKISERPDNAITQKGEKARHTYYAALNVVKEIAEKASKGIAGVRKARRLAQDIVDLVSEDSSLMLGLATIKDYDDYTYTHSVNVALLATCLGRQIGLSNVFLEYLTICGLFHDLGKVGVSKEILHKTGDLNEEEWNEMRNHPLIGVKKIIRLKAPHILKAKIILGPFEHHLNPDLTGYPQTHFIKELSLTGKILRIADVYEALTSDRDYRSQTLTPDAALRHMWDNRNKKFDLLLLKSFINMVGLYPIGSVVELNSGEIGLVIDYHDESAKHMPVILLLVDNGREWISGELVNIASPEQEADTQYKKIVRGINPALLGIQPSEFFCSI